MILIIFAHYYYFNIPLQCLEKVKTLLKENCILYFGLPYKSVITKLDVTDIYLCDKESITKINNITYEEEGDFVKPLELYIEEFTHIFHLKEFKDAITNENEPIIFIKTNENIKKYDFSHVKDHPQKKKSFVFPESDSLKDVPILNIFQHYP